MRISRNCIKWQQLHREQSLQTFDSSNNNICDITFNDDTVEKQQKKNNPRKSPQTLLMIQILMSSIMLLSTTMPTSHAWTTTSITTTITSTRNAMNSIQRNVNKSLSLPPSSSSLSSTTTSLFMVGATTTSTDASSSSSNVSNENMPELGKDGVYHILNEQHHKALLESFPDKLIVMKVFAPWCRACKGLEPKFNAMVRQEKYAKLPIIWADLTIQHNKDFVKSIGVLALPTIQFYVQSQIADTFPCGPSKVPILRRKLAQLVNDHVDSETLQVIPTALDSATSTASTKGTETSESTNAPTPMTTTASTTATTSSSASTGTSSRSASSQPAILDQVRVIQSSKSKLRNIPYFRGLLESEFESMLDKSTLLTFEAGNIIMREGNAGRTLYFIVQGEVEICQRTSYLEDPLTTPPTYLGTVINRIGRGEYFGERALVTGEPRAASLRAAGRTTCLAIDQDDIPTSCLLSGKRYVGNVDTATDDASSGLMNDKYGVALGDMSQYGEQQQYQQALQASQVRGSVNRPQIIDGVDNDVEVPIYDVDDEEGTASPDTLVFDSEDTILPTIEDGDMSTGKVTLDLPQVTQLGANPEVMVPLLLRFKLVRLVTRCFDYIIDNRLRLGDEGSQKRRMLLVNLLSLGQQAEIRDAYALLDADQDGEITLEELRRLMESVGDVRSESELKDFIETSHVGDDGKQILTYRDFFGIMAEVELYYLFLETFAALDTHDSGFVRAKDLDRVLCGIRDLVTGDRYSIIDVDDTEMMVDYEQFSKMLLGGSLS